MLLLIQENEKNRNIKNLIYIPLCFYLYEDGTVVNIADLLAFTFHYASTYTGKKTFGAYDGRHLHSTMLLLIPSSVVSA